MPTIDSVATALALGVAEKLARSLALAVADARLNGEVPDGKGLIVETKNLSLAPFFEADSENSDPEQVASEPVLWTTPVEVPHCPVLGWVNVKK